MASFCKYCGKVLQDGEICTCPQAQAEAAAAHAQGQQPPPNFYQQPPQQPQYQQYGQPAYNPYDHTAEFDPKDISDNKVFAMLVYLMGILGVVIALLASHASPYAMFHVRQSLKLTVTGTLALIAAAIVAVVLVWTIFIPLIVLVAYGIVSVILFVLQIICFFNVCYGKAKEPAIICKLGFLR